MKVKKVVFLMLFSIFIFSLFAVEKFSEKIWFVRPSFQFTNEGNSPYLFFKVPYKARMVKVRNGRIYILWENNFKIYSPDFSLIDEVKNIKGKMGIPIYDDPGFFEIKSPNEIFFGFPDRKKKCYYIFLYNLKAKKARLILKLDKKQFPGVAPIKRVEEVIKSDPSFLDDYFGYVYSYSNFFDAHYDVGKLFMWFLPNYGMHFGGLYVYDIYDKKLLSPYKKFNKIHGFSGNDYAYSLIKDDDATTVDDSIYFKLYRKKYVIKNVLFKRGISFSGESVAYVSKDGGIYIKNVYKDRIVAKFNLSGDKFKLLKLSLSGNRLFFYEEKRGLMFYDVRSKKIEKLVDYKKIKNAISYFYTCPDGEFVFFRDGDGLWAGYLTDLMPPFLRISSKFFISGKTYKSKIKVKFEAVDTCFVSGLSKGCITFCNEKYSVGDSCEINLKEGRNKLLFLIRDRAGNVRKVVKQIIYEKPLKTTLEEISKNPQKFNERYVLLKGYAWGYAWGGFGRKDFKEIKKLYKLPLAPGNDARSRSDGTFSDGKYTAFIPISPIEVGKFEIVCKIKIYNGKWRIIPVEFHKLNR